MSNSGSPVCYKCNRPGHMARECSIGGAGGRGGGRDFFRGRDKCYKCNKMGHFARYCKEDVSINIW